MKTSAIVLSLLTILAGSARAGEEAEVSALVQTGPLRMMTIVKRIEGLGTVTGVADATANLSFAKAGQVRRLKVVAGQKVHAGETLLEVDTDPASTLAFGQAENAVEFARGELSRVQSLFQQQLATRSQVEGAARVLKDSEQALEAQRALGGQAKLDSLVAPFDGLVVSVSATPGDRFAPGASLLQLARTAVLRVRLGVEPGDSRTLRAGSMASLASLYDPQSVVEGEVGMVAAQVDPQTGLVDVTVFFSGAVLPPGSRVRGTIAASKRQARAVPRQSLLRDGDESYVFQVVKGHAHRVVVDPGTEDGEWIEVKGEGLEPEAPVVVLGNYELQDGMAVREARR